MIFLFFGLAIPICICDLKNLRIPNIYNLLIFYVSVINAVIFGFPEKDIVIKSGLIIGIFAIVGIGVGDLKLLGSVLLTTVNDPFTFLGFILVMALGHIDPNFSYWTTSGEFVFVAILAGSQSVVAVMLSSLVLEMVRSFSSAYFPNTWQLALGIFLLLVIRFMPLGLGSLWSKTEKPSEKQP
jgi:hypothetical protein